MTSAAPAGRKARIRRAVSRLRWRAWVELELRTRRRPPRGTRLTVTRPGPAAKEVFIVPPASPGSTGDESFVLSVVQQARQRGWQPTVVRVSEQEEWGRDTLGAGVLCMPRHQSPRTVRAVREFARRVRPADVLLYLGTDAVGGAYGRDAISHLMLVKAVCAAGARAAVISFSFDPEPDRLALRVLRSLPRDVPLVARDQESSLRAQAALGRPVTLGADVAFLVEDDDASPDNEGTERALAWIGLRRAKGRTVIGVNINSLLLGISPFDDSPTAREQLGRMLDAMTRALGTLIAEDSVSVVLIPHDERGVWSDEVLAERLAERLAGAYQEDTLALRRLPVFSTRRLCGSVDAVVSGRMHLLISCLAVGCPVGSLTYLGKFDGLLRETGLDAWSLPGQRIVHPGEVTELARRIIRDRELMISRERSALPALCERAARNFAVLWLRAAPLMVPGARKRGEGDNHGSFYSGVLLK
ncbi:MAG TPA: polysaccharide pyruvyl transferase family protein [Trebonia sp.]|nr:polysaccharide pyruvyl transferase family protein [Trebonia sp.]